MKKQWAAAWVSSNQPRKQRKYRHNAPLHIKHKLIASHLSKELRIEYGKRSFPVIKGDEVVVLVGKSKKMKGVVDRVNLKKGKIYIEGITVKKVDGSEVMNAMEPSNVMITKLKLDDKKRIGALNKMKKGANSG